MASTTLKNYYNYKKHNITGIIHVGMNSGEEHEWYSSLNVPLLYFEPIPSVFEKLKNKCNNAICEQLAIGSKDQEIELHVASNSGNSSSILKPTEHLVEYPQIIYSEKILVQMKTLDNYLLYNSLSYNTLVIDVEGYELEVLKGSSNTLGKIQYLLVETYQKSLYENCVLFPELNSFLDSKGFNLIRHDTYHAGWGNAFYERKQ